MPLTVDGDGGPRVSTMQRSPYDSAMERLARRFLKPGPPMLLRRRKLLLIATLVCFAAAGTYVVLDDALNLRHRRYWKFGAILVAITPPVVLRPIWFLRIRGLRDRAERARGRLCGHCAYDVSDLGMTGTCPECGGAFDVKRDAKLWHEYFADHQVGFGRRQKGKGSGVW
jgi:hypothetical protein